MNLDVFGNAMHATFFQDVRRLWVDPDTIKSPLWLMLPHHLIGSTDVETLKPGQGRAGKIPRLAAVQ